MALEALEALHRGERGVDPGRELVRRDEAEIVGGQGREQSHADVRGRGPVGHPGLGGLLEVVRGQGVVLGAHEGLEVAPGVAGDADGGTRDRLPRARPVAAHGLAQRVRDERRGRPQGEEGEGDQERAGAQRGHEEQRDRGDHRARDHLPQEDTRARPLRGPAPRAALAAAVSHSSRRRWVAPRRTRVSTIAWALS